MIRILDITLKDLVQLLRDRKIFLFLLIMPIAFTLLFGYAWGGFGGGEADPRLPVGYLDEDGSWVSESLHELLSDSEVIRLDMGGGLSQAELEGLVADEKLAAAIIVPFGYGHDLLRNKGAKVIVIADTGLPAGMSVESEALTAVIHLDSAIRTAVAMERAAGERVPFEYAYEEALAGWEEPPIQVRETTSSAIADQGNGSQSLAHFAPGTMLQFAIAGLLTSAQVMVSERKSRSLQRMLTTATRRGYILLGHYLTIFAMIFGQFIVLILFGQVILKINYQNSPQATALVALASAVCIAALGLLIGVMAKSEEQAVVFSLIPMFILSGVGGAWVPLEVVGGTFQVIGHVSPVAWAMDGFKSITIRGLGVESVMLPSAVLVGYGMIFFVLAMWRFGRAEG
jgi:ABC-2 type transport system permease protein